MSVAALALGRVARAAEWEVSALGAWHSYAYFTELGRRVGEPDRGLDAAVGAGMRGTVWWLVPSGVDPGLGIEAEGIWLPTDQRSAGKNAMGQSGTLLRRVQTSAWRGNAVVAVGGARLHAVFLGGVGVSELLSSFGVPRYDVDTESHFGAGLRWLPNADLALRLDARLQVVPSSNPEARFTSEPEVTVSIGWRFGRAPPPHLPQPPPDTDDDGVIDSKDVCPLEAETRNGVRDEDGCPEDPAVLARGASTTEVEAEHPPGEEGAEHWAKALPPLQERDDADHDEVWGDDDHCPDAAEDKDGMDDFDGCPDVDDDADGIADALDKCRLVAEIWNGYQDEDGCPDELPRPLQQYTGVIEGIFFKFKSADIEKKSEKVLLAAAKVFSEFVDVNVAISGHTDDVGTADDNLALSQRRADSVRKWLIDHMISADRLTATGYGLSQPVTPLRDKKSRALNRRVEFKLVPKQP